MTSDAHDFVHTFFKKGAEFTEELLRENERLRAKAVELETENASLRTQLASDEAMRDLMRKINELEDEKNDLLSRVHAAGAVSTRFSTRFAEVEEELAQLANLYIASYQLHGSLEAKTVILHLRELCAQLVGARSFGLYWLHEGRNELVPVIAEGGHPSKPIPVGADSPAERAFLTGIAKVHEGLLATAEIPIALVPLMLDGKPKGVLVIDSVLEQKDRFLPVDFELFKMLGGHAAIALAGALLFHAANGQLPEMNTSDRSDRNERGEP